MSIEKLIQIQECQNKQLLDELSKMPPMVLATAYLHAINYTLYGKDVTEKWVTATEQASALEKAYKKGYYDALQEMKDSQKTCRWTDVELGHYVLLHRCSNCSHCSDTASNYCPNCGAKMEGKNES